MIRPAYCPFRRIARKISSRANAGALQLPCCWILAKGLFLFVIGPIPADHPHRLRLGSAGGRPQDYGT